jgi:hypothetical protein
MVMPVMEARRDDGARAKAPPPAASIAHSLQGRLEDLSLPDIMQVVQSMAKTGALILTRADGARAMCVFRSGRLVQAATDEGYETLGDRLIAKDVITRAQLDESLRHMAQFPGMRVGDALAEKGFATRQEIESECSAHLTATVGRLMAWRDAGFEFRVGQVSTVAEMPSLELDFVLDNGVEPVQVLLRASILQDEDGRETRDADAPGAAREAAEPDREREVARAISAFDGAGEPGEGSEDSDASPALQKLLRVSEELHSALAPAETRLLLLRYASQVYAHGALVVRNAGGFSLAGSFGSGFPLVSSGTGAPGEGSLLGLVASTRRPYLGSAFVTDEGGLAAAPRRAEGTFSVLCVPLVLLGEVRLVLCCRQLHGGPQDVRALIVVARQAGVMFENLMLRKRTPPPRTLPPEGRR